ncbi:hypothetical protein NLU13_7712 [Sarocladium strictum]|uniref:Large ribosomal subunit protein uL6 alpha-beta domain-containing protein n=1 Tax=Sarocladium strictum TaxID=5046 RepID=A0AA39GDM0_SARSR|nr:hypothetical protein NLU13_7712 [Sarocladium strictum]
MAALSVSGRSGRVLCRSMGASTPLWRATAAAVATNQTRTTNTPISKRAFSATTSRASKLGRTPLSIPPGVEITMGEPVVKRSMTTYETTTRRTITVKGPLGELQLEVPEFVVLDQDLENKSVTLNVKDTTEKEQKEMWGTSWSYLNNHIMGVSEGHTAILRLVGVGYRATVEERGGKKAQFPGQKFLCLKLGFTHPVEEPIPKGITVTTPQPTRILVEGVDKEAIMSFAGRVRMWRPPEPYKGKGVFINDQTIKLKQKKIK